MDSLTNWWAAHRPTTRRLAQVYCALLYNANLKGFVDGQIYTGPVKAACVPGFNCYSCPGAIGACPLGALQNALASSGARAGTYVLGILMLFGVMLGRTICGWLCPLGLIQELLHKIPTPKIRKSKVTRALSYLKYVFLAVFVLAIPLWYAVTEGIPLPGFCKYICPAGTLEGAVGLLSNPKNDKLFSLLGLLFTRKFVIMLVIGLACVFCYRSFCRFICPLGAIYSFFCRVAIIGVKVDESACIHCDACVRHCQMDVHHVGDHECIHCGSCMDVCPTRAISLKAGKVTLKAAAPRDALKADPVFENEEKKRRFGARIAWTVALAALILALLYFNGILPSPGKPSGSSSLNPAPVETTADASADSEEAEETANPENTEEDESKTEPKKADHTESAAETETSVGPETSAESETSAEMETTAEPESSPAEDYTSDAPIGNEVGDQLADFTITTVGGETFHLAETRGNVTFINLWATYCTPCVKELPYFSQLQQEHPEISILAVHSSLVTDDVEEYLADKDWVIDFAVDTDDDLIYGIVGGDTLLPQTIVLNERGEVVYNQVGSVTYEVLAALLEQAESE